MRDEAFIDLSGGGQAHLGILKRLIQRTLDPTVKQKITEKLMSGYRNLFGPHITAESKASFSDFAFFELTFEYYLTHNSIFNWTMAVHKENKSCCNSW